MTLITYDEFEQVEIRVGQVIKVEYFTKTRKPAYKLWIDFGEFGIKKSSAQITKYAQEDLVGKQILAVTNFRPRQIANFMSEVVLVLGVVLDNDEVVLIRPDKEVILGKRIL